MPWIRPAFLGLLFAASACASAPPAGGAAAVVFAVRNEAQAALEVEACGAGTCDGPRVLRPGERARFSLPMDDRHTQYRLTATYGNRVVVQRVMEIYEPGTFRIDLDPGDPVP